MHAHLLSAKTAPVKPKSEMAVSELAGERGL